MLHQRAEPFAAVDVPPQERRHLAPVPRPAREIAEVRRHQLAVAVLHDAYLREQAQHGHEVRRRGAAAGVTPRQQGAVPARARRRRLRHFRGRGEIAVGEAVQQLPPQAAVVAAVDGHEHAHALLREQRQLAVEPLGVAGVAEDVLAVAVHVVPAQRHRVQAGHRGAVVVLHLAQRGGREDPRAAVAAALQLGEHEARHRLAAGRQRAGRRRVHQLERPWRRAGVRIAQRHVRRQRLRQRLAEAGVPHAQRLQDVLLHVVVERLAGHALHDVARQRRAVVGIRGHLARWIHALGHPLLHPRRVAQVVLRVGGEQVLDRLLEARRVRHQLAQRHRLAVARRYPEIEVAVHVRVEVEPALLHQLHHRRPGEQLGDRAHPEQRAGRIDRLARRHVGVAVAPGQQHLAVLHDHHHRGGEAVLLQSVRHQAVQPRRRIVRAELACAQRRGLGRRVLRQRAYLDLRQRRRREHRQQDAQQQA